ncbi:MAG: Y-family DNA polymerase [Bacteroidota bacterium]
MPRRLFALVDCANFYASCERIFDPSLEGTPIAVLSNNDGCVIARSEEVKAAGVPMAAPYFTCRRELERIGARVFSSNYSLYADMSRRVMETLHTVTPDVEVYSVDEAFLVIPGPEAGADPGAEHARLGAVARSIRERVWRWTGVPTRVAIAETKTLAKAGVTLAKRLQRHGGEPALCFWNHPAREAHLASMSVRDVWGISRRWGRRLEGLGAATVDRLVALPDPVIRKTLSVVGLRTAYELRGVACLGLEHDPPIRRSLIRSRSFRQPISDLATISEAVATHAARAGEKLRREGLVAGRVAALVTTKGVGEGPHRTGWLELPLSTPTNRTPDLIRAAKSSAAQSFEARDFYGNVYRYRKAGVVCTDLRPARPVQTQAFVPARTFDPAWADGQDRLHAAMDRLNRRFGRRTVAFAAQGAPRNLRALESETVPEAGGTPAPLPAWGMARDHTHHAYTTRWESLPVVRA